MPDTWIGSIDVNDWVQKLLNMEMSKMKDASDKHVAPLKTTESALKNQISIYSQLQTLLNTFQQQISALNTAFTPTYQVTSSNTSVATASVTTGSTTSAGSHTMSVTQLAQSESISTAPITTSSSTQALSLTDSITLAVGSNQFTVNIGPNDSLSTIAANINTGAAANNVGVNAVVQQVGDGQYQLVVSSTNSGVANKVTITDTGSLGLTNEQTAAQDALFTFDKMSFDLSSNNNIMVEGITLNLTGTGGPVTINTSATNPVTSATTAVQNVVNAYNQIDLLIEKTQAISGAPDSTMTLILSSLQGAMFQSVGGASGYSQLADIGITLNNAADSIDIILANGKDATFTPAGQLLVNTTTLSTALTNNFTGVQSLLTNTQNGIFNNINTMLNNAPPGVVWKALNDPNSGGIRLAQNQIKTIHDEITQEQSRMDSVKKDLIFKYAKLDEILSHLQSTSRYVSQQIAIMNGPRE